MNVSRCDVTLYEEFKNKARTMPHDELYYALLDWADQHKDVKEEYIKSIDAYEVRYIHKNGEHISKLFKAKEYPNPYSEARKLVGEVWDDCECLEFWHKGHPAIGTSELILSKG